MLAKTLVFIGALWALSGGPVQATPNAQTNQCTQAKTEIADALKRIDETRQAYRKTAKKLEEEIEKFYAAALTEGGPEAQWREVRAFRGLAKRQAQQALKTADEGFFLMEKHSTTGCIKADLDDLKARHQQSKDNYTQVLEKLKRIPLHWQTVLKTPKTCPALIQAMEEENARTTAYAKQNDEAINDYNKARSAYNRAIDFDENSAKGWQKLLDARIRALPGLQGYIGVMEALYESQRQIIFAQCAKINYAQEVAFEKSAKQTLEQIKVSLDLLQSMPLKKKAYEKAYHNASSARISIINTTQKRLCVFSKDNPEGNCKIEPGGRKRFELKAFLADPKAEPSGKITVQVNDAFGEELLDPDRPKVRKVLVCDKRTFKHKKGGVVWVIKPGKRRGCVAPTGAP
jgi:tetratricopeptide (TPR) repeat protein